MEKEKRREIAQKHFEEMWRLYGKEIKASINRAEIFEGGINIPKKGTVDPEIMLVKCGSDALATGDGKTAILNFASFKNPGGGFIKGALAQEEALCHVSTLYNVLSGKMDFYEYNREHLNNSLYEDRLLYTPDIIFVNSGRAVKSDVITCAAPNYTAAKKHGKTEEQTLHAMRKRIRMVLDAAMNHDVERLILGAFGCGVFGNDAIKVGNIFAEEILKGISIKNIFFAVPDDKNFVKLKEGLNTLIDAT